MAISSDLKLPRAGKAARTPCSCGHGWDGPWPSAWRPDLCLEWGHAPSGPASQPQSRGAMAGLNSATVYAGRGLGGTFVPRGHSEIGRQSLLPGRILDKDAHCSITWAITYFIPYLIVA